MSAEIKEVTATPTIDTNAYASADHLGTVMTLTDVVPLSGGSVKLDKIVVVDKAKQSSALDILFFNASPTLTSVDNGALDISDSEMASKFLGSVRLAQAEYIDLNVNSTITVRNVELNLRAANGSTTLYAILQSRGSPTYGAASDLVVKLSFESV